MNPTVFIYLVASLCFLLPLGGYFLTAYLGKKNGSEKPAKIYGKVLAIAALVVFFLMLFFVPPAITAKEDPTSPGYYKPGIGLVNLVGVPYGNNRAANFFAWFGMATFLPSAAMAILFCILPSKCGLILKRFVAFPILALNSFCLFNLVSGFTGGVSVSYKTALVAGTCGLCLSCSIMDIVRSRS